MWPISRHVQAGKLVRGLNQLYINIMAMSPPACVLKRRLPAVFLSVLVTAAPLQALPLITEFLASNDSILADEDGDFSDWIEVFNPDC